MQQGIGIGRSVIMALQWCFFMLLVVGSTSARFITIHNVTLSSDYSITSEDLLKSLTKSFVEYDKNLDDYIQWVEFDDMFRDMLNHDGEFSMWGIADVRRFFLQSRDYYFDAVTAVYGWCGEIDTLMTAYIELFNDYSREVKEAQKAIIVHVLDEGIEKMTSALENLDKSRKNLNTGVIELTNLMSNISEVFRYDESQYEEKMYELNKNIGIGFIFGPFVGIVNLIVIEAKIRPESKERFEKIQSSFDFMKSRLMESIDKAYYIKQKLEAEIQNVINLQAAAKSNKVLMRFNFYNVIKNAANKLIGKCSAYQTKHGLNFKY